MVAFSGEKIRQMAVGRTRVDFLRSQQVADRIAADVRQRLEGHIHAESLRRYIKTGPNKRWVGTFSVESLLPIVTRLGEEGRQEAIRIHRLVAEALRASVRSDDFVQGWTSPLR